MQKGFCGGFGFLSQAGVGYMWLSGCYVFFLPQEVALKPDTLKPHLL